MLRVADVRLRADDFHPTDDNVKADYVKAAWNIANWENVAQRLEVARQQTNGLLVLS